MIGKKFKNFRARDDLVLKLRGLIENKSQDRIHQKQTSSSSQPFHQRGKNSAFAEKLMTNEWLIEIPEDFGEWIMLPCPVARRCLVVAANVINYEFFE